MADRGTPHSRLPALLLIPLGNEVGVILLLLAGMALVVWLLAGGPRVAHYTPAAPPPATGLHALERRADGGAPYRWTTGRSHLDLPNPGGPLLLRLDLSAGARGSVGAVLSGPIDVRLRLGADLRQYRLLVPAQPGERIALELSTPPFVPPGETREVGVVLGEIGVWGGGAAPSALITVALLTTVALYLTIRTFLCPPGAGISVALAMGSLLAWHLGGRWVAWTFAPLGAIAALVTVLVAGGWPLALGAGVRWQAARDGQAPGAGAVGTHVRADRRGSRAPRTLALTGLVIGGMGMYLAVGLWNHWNVHPGLALDLEIYLRAGHLALAGQSPYDPPDLNVIGVSFVYPPPTLPLFATLANVEPWLAHGLWLAGSVALYLLALLGIYAAQQGVGRTELAAMLGLGLGFAPFLENLAIGQINSLMLFGLVLFVLGYSERRLAWVGDVALAVVMLIKLTPVVLLLWPLARGDWRRLTRVALGAVALSLPALVLYGPAPWMAFAQLLPDLLRGVPRNPYNQALAALLTGLTAPGSTAEQTAAWLGRAFSLGLLITWAAICWGRRGANDGAILACGIVILTVSSSLIWYHHLMFLTLPLAWLALAAPPRSPWPGLALLALGLIQATRPIESGLGMLPWPAVAGYLILVSAWIVRNAAEPSR
ncbi:MAG: glycosyltransferase family 87 protein [Chloroflexaceae bacterium]